MHLTPHEIDKLTLHQAGVLAQKRLARGVRLNHPEAVALIATQILEFIRDGQSVAALMDLGRRLLGRADVMDGVPELVHEVQVEGTFPDGTKLVTVHHPIAAEHGDLELALYGSFLPVPAYVGLKPDATAADSDTPGAITCAPGQIAANEGRKTAQLAVTNTGDRPIQVGSHYHFVETNRALAFDRPPHAACVWHPRRHGCPVRTRRNTHRLAGRHRRERRHPRRQRLRPRIRESLNLLNPWTCGPVDSWLVARELVARGPVDSWTLEPLEPLNPYVPFH
jgi:urease subunit gamma/beta